MRRLATAVPTAVLAVAAVLTLSTGTALAHGPEHAARSAHGGSATHHAKKAEKGQKGQKPKPLVTMSGVISDTPTATIGAPGGSPSDTATATIGSASDTATSTITIAVRGGERALHMTTVVLTLDSSTVIRRGDRAATAADLSKGDHVSVRARRMPDGSWLALRINASGPPRTDADDRD